MSAMNNVCFLNKSDDDGGNYASVPQEENTEKVWTNHFRGCIVESVYSPKKRRIEQYQMPFNQLQNSINYYNSEHKKNQAGSCKKVNEDLYTTTSFR
jgi:hypothetical protein